jgi:predicted dienelactone hydrolase
LPHEVAAGDVPARDRTGTHAVVTADLTLTDAKRKKELPLRAHFPKDGGPYPVIVFSHGFGGSKAFWDAHLQGAADAVRYLQSDRLAKDSGGKYTFERE